MAYTDGQFGAWTPVGAEKTAGAIRWPGSIGTDDQYFVWNTDGNGNWTSYATGVVSGSDIGAAALETAFQQDLNGDGPTGPTTTPLETFGTTDLVQVGNQFFLRDSGGKARR